MQYAFTAATLAASAFFSSVSGAAIQARSVCGTAPAGTTNQTPLAQPSGITTAALCAAQCQAQSGCLSFQFGMVNGADQCLLYSVAASNLPAQTDLVAYDIGCSSFPSVVPTASNPTGVEQSNTGGATGNSGTTGNTGAAGSTGNTGSAQSGAHKRQQQGTHDAPVNQQPSGNPNPIAEPTESSLDACLAACKANAACVAYTFTSNQCKLFGPTNNKMIRQQQGTHDAPVNQQPSGNPTPIATPTENSLDACLAACQANAACVAYTFTSNQCKLFGPTNNKMIRQQQGTHANPMNQQPAGNPTPIATPAENSLDACLAACQANAACVAYTFASNTCKLFGATNNKMIRQQQGTHANPMNQQPAGNPTPIATPAENSLDACLAACQNNAACVAYTFESNTCKLFGATNNKRQSHANPMNQQPAGNPTPIATPSENSLDACLAACEGNPSCVAYTFSNNVCSLFGPTTGKKMAREVRTASRKTRQFISRQTHDAPMNGVPAGNPTPIATSTPASKADCLAACQGNPACVAYTFISGQCKLFA